MSVRESKEFYEKEIENMSSDKVRKAFLTRSFNTCKKEYEHMKEGDCILYHGEPKAPQMRDMEDEMIAINKVRSEKFGLKRLEF